MSHHGRDSSIASSTSSSHHSSSSPSLTPSGPICTFGPRLAYTYFPSPSPRAELLNSSQQQVHFFTIDDQLLYLSFFQDSGPLNAACLYRFCLHVHTLLEDPAFSTKRVFLYSSDEPDKKANAALLMALYAMVVMRWSVADVLHPIACLELQPFRDAGYARADYHLSPQSILYGISRAISSHLLDLSTFDLVAYETYEKVENGDWNWITPGFVAFASPVEPSYVASLGGGIGERVRKLEGARPRLGKAFGNVLEEFERGGVKVVVRLNKKLYDATHFTERGMEHVEMYFDDGTNPTLEMTREFIDLADRTISGGGAVAVHCKAGLGRTGTLIGAYLIYKHGFTASEAIGFMRLMRPGSCVGPQQHYLYENQMTWIRWAAIDQVKAEQRAEQALLPQATSSKLNHLRQTTPPLQTRPITPPNEAELARSRANTPGPSNLVGGGTGAPRTPAPVPPRTPGRPVAVPGQPRKTPGKSKHSVATPEVQHPEPTTTSLEEELEGTAMVEDREDLMLVGEEEEVEEMVVPHPVVQARRPVTPGNTTNNGRPTRIARARATTSTSTSTTNNNNNSRPLSAIADNRIVDRLGGVGTSGTITRFGRSKAVKDLGTLFEGPTSTTTQPSSSSTSSTSNSTRYDLRRPTSPDSSIPISIPTLATGPPASPSKLPTRIPAKRGFVPVPGGALTSQREKVASVGLSRSVRRRRSSLGSTDFA